MLYRRAKALPLLGRAEVLEPLTEAVTHPESSKSNYGKSQREGWDVASPLQVSPVPGVGNTHETWVLSSELRREPRCPYPPSEATHLQVSELAKTRTVLPLKSCSLVVPSIEEVKNWLVSRGLNFSPVMLPPAPI